MITRTSENWNCVPGYFDVHNTFQTFLPTVNEFEIPELQEQPSDLIAPYALVPYNVRIRSEQGYDGLGIHFFLDDYRFEQTWVKPDTGLERVKKAYAALTPDFSLYLDMPIAVQIYNTYKSRWVGRYWQEAGINVIPTLSWSDKRSFKFCFAGIPKNQIVAVSTVSVNKQFKSNFLDGYFEAVAQTKPKFIMCYGQIFDEMMYNNIPIKSYKPSFEGLRHLRKQKQ